MKSSGPLRAFDVKQHNSNMILSRIHAARGSGGVSQSEMVAMTGLKAPSVFRIFSALEGDDLIKPCGTCGVADGLGKKGRRPMSYTVNPSARFIIGVEFWAGCVALGVFNFHGERIHSSMADLSDDCDADMVMGQVERMVHQCISLLNLPEDKIIGIGIAAPGKVDIKRGRVVFYHKIKGMINYPIVAILQERLGLEVTLHNNCAAIAYDLFKYGGLGAVSSLFCFLLRSGVNGTLVSGNGIFLESDQTTLEAGHIPLALDGPRCSCGLQGCLQAYFYELDREYSGENNVNLFSNLEEPLSRGDSKALGIVRKAALYLHAEIKLISRFLAPEAFVLVGLGDLVPRAIAMEAEKLLKADEDSMNGAGRVIHCQQYDTLMAQRGASDLVLNRFFSD